MNLFATNGTEEYLHHWLLVGIPSRYSCVLLRIDFSVSYQDTRLCVTETNTHLKNKFMSLLKLYVTETNTHVKKIWSASSMSRNAIFATNNGKVNQFLPTVPTFAVRETDVSRTANVATVGKNWLRAFCRNDDVNIRATWFGLRE